MAAQPEALAGGAMVHSRLPSTPAELERHQPQMRNTRLIVVLSLLLSTLLIAGALVCAPEMRFRYLSGMERLVGVLIFVLFSWPWVVAFFLANKPRAWLGVKVFACASVVGAALVFMPIATASEDGIDDFVRVYLLGVWIVGPLLLLIRSRKHAQ